MSDIVDRLRISARAWSPGRPNTYDEAADEIERLRHWKAEATAVIEAWESAWESAGSPGVLGRPKSLGMLNEIVRLRTLGDNLARAYRTLGGLGVAYDRELRAWEDK